jgi:hypothetical protein
VGHYRPKSAGAKVIAGLAAELLERLEARVSAVERRVA